MCPALLLYISFRLPFSIKVIKREARNCRKSDRNFKKTKLTHFDFFDVNFNVDKEKKNKDRFFI